MKKFVLCSVDYKDEETRFVTLRLGDSVIPYNNMIDMFWKLLHEYEGSLSWRIKDISQQSLHPAKDINGLSKP